MVSIMIRIPISLLRDIHLLDETLMESDKYHSLIISLCSFRGFMIKKIHITFPSTELEDELNICVCLKYALACFSNTIHLL